MGDTAGWHNDNSHLLVAGAQKAGTCSHALRRLRQVWSWCWKSQAGCDSFGDFHTRSWPTHVCGINPSSNNQKKLGSRLTRPIWPGPANLAWTGQFGLDHWLGFSLECLETCWNCQSMCIYKRITCLWFFFECHVSQQSTAPANPGCWGRWRGAAARLQFF